jgi:hypothetical protein
MRLQTAGTAVLLVMLSARGAQALDCARVLAMHDEGKRAADIARALGITTPDVQGCIAGELGEEKAVKPPDRGGAATAPQLPTGDSPIPRPPNQ